MDLNKDGFLDMISGSYRSGAYGKPTSDYAPMHIFWGSEDDKFSLPKVLRSSDKKPLAMNSAKGDEHISGQTIKSAPFPVDLNGDGNLDIVSGNSAGTFAFFPAKGNVKYDPTPTWLTTENGEKLKVAGGASGPVFIDWDNDGDMDMLSGSAWRNVYLFTNTGTKTDPKFSPAVTLIEAEKNEKNKTNDTILGVDHIKQPGSIWRIAVGDVNQDGKHDILVGDRQFLTLQNEGISDSDAMKRLAVWQAKNDALNENDIGLDFDNEDNWTEIEKNSWNTYVKEADSLDEELNQFAKKREAGFVWIYLQK